MLITGTLGRPASFFRLHGNTVLIGATLIMKGPVGYDAGILSPISTFLSGARPRRQPDCSSSKAAVRIHPPPRKPDYVKPRHRASP